MQTNLAKYPHYFKDVSKFEAIDVYRVLDLFGVTSAPVAHAAKKLLCAGERGDKDFLRDIKEARDALNRLLQMHDEDAEIS